MPFYQYTTVRQYVNDEGRLILETLNDAIWAPNAELIAERAAVISEEKFPGTKLLGTIVNQIYFGLSLKRGIIYGWTWVKSRFKAYWTGFEEYNRDLN